VFYCRFVVWYFAFRLLANLLMSAAAASQYNCAVAATVIARRAIELPSGTDCALSFSLQTSTEQRNNRFNIAFLPSAVAYA